MEPFVRHTGKAVALPLVQEFGFTKAIHLFTECLERAAECEEPSRRILNPHWKEKDRGSLASRCRGKGCPEQVQSAGTWDGLRRAVPFRRGPGNAIWGGWARV